MSGYSCRYQKYIKFQVPTIYGLGPEASTNCTQDYQPDKEATLEYRAALMMESKTSFLPLNHIQFTQTVYIKSKI